ncbi:MAG: HD domain-containing protein [Candidatus Aminicenantes bacterium]|jgi:putative nucleotidyltransferase with HDIG domain
MRKELLAVMPEFNLIEDSDLKEKTITVWVEAMKEEGWTVDDLQQMPFTLLIEETPVNIIEHTRAVTLSSVEIAEVMVEEYKGKLTLNRDYLLSGALLHDVGKLFEYKREKGKFVKSRGGELLRHPISGAAFASQHGLPKEVVHIIAAHSKEGDGSRKTVEAVIVNHADFVNFEALKIKA